MPLSEGCVFSIHALCGAYELLTISLTEYGIYISEKQTMEYLYIVFRLPVFTTYKELLIFQDDRDGVQVP